MRIECKIIRPGGSFVDIGGINYHFKPVSEAQQAAHVADVEDDEHIARFLAIPEGYRIYNPDRKAAVKPTVVEAEPGDDAPTVQPSGLGMPDAELSKPQLIAWVNANLPELDYNPKLNKEAILRAISDKLQG